MLTRAEREALAPNLRSHQRGSLAKRPKGDGHSDTTLNGPGTMLVSNQDQATARRLPDEFWKMPGTPLDRATALVNLYWIFHTATARADLARVLAFVLQPLLKPAARVTEQKRQTCEDIVTSWLSRTS